MRASEIDWQTRLEDKKRERVLGDVSSLRQIAQGEVLATQLTGSAEWDSFLRIVKGLRDEAQNLMEAYQSQICGGPPKSADELLHLQTFTRCAQWRIAALDEVMEIPKALSEQGERAKELIAKYAKD